MTNKLINGAIAIVMIGSATTVTKEILIPVGKEIKQKVECKIQELKRKREAKQWTRA